MMVDSANACKRFRERNLESGRTSLPLSLIESCRSDLKATLKILNSWIWRVYKALGKKSLIILTLNYLCFQKTKRITNNGTVWILGQLQKTQNGLLVFGLFYCEINSNKIFHSHSYIGFFFFFINFWGRTVKTQTYIARSNVFLSENQQTVLIFF